MNIYSCTDVPVVVKDRRREVTSESQDWSTAERLLDGLTVLELGDRIAVGACGGLFARLGARVVLVEPPASMKRDKWAQRAAMAAGKLSIVVDRNTEDGHQEVARLLEAADVVLLSSDRSRANLVIWDAERPEGQIVCDITAFGHTGPLAGKAVSEALLQAIAGVAHTTGPRDGGPAVTGAPFIEMETAVYATAAILAALYARRTLGIGQRIDIALYDVAVNALLTFIPLHIVGLPAIRNGNRHPTSAPWNAYRARDGWVLICGPTNDQWRRLCQAMDTPHFVQDPRFATTSARFENVEELDRIIGAWVNQHTVAACIERVSAQGIPVSSIVGIDDLEREPNLRHRAMVQAKIDPVTGASVRVSGSPFRMAAVPAVQSLAVPLPNQDRTNIEAQQHSRSVRPRKIVGDRYLGRLPLEGIRVIEIGMNTVAPLAGRQLGALGADVIKVEPPAGDSNRVNAPLREDGEAYVFALSNTDKRGVVLDLKQTADRDALWRILATADMAIENLKPGSLVKLGFGAAEVLRRFPRMIYCSVNGFGFDTAYPGRPALDTVIQAMSGAMSATIVGDMPTKSGISISDQLGGQFGLAAMLAALERRERTGLGVHLDLAMQDCSAWATHTIWNSRGEAGTPIVRILAAKDGYVAVECESEAAAAALPENCGELSRVELVARLGAISGCSSEAILTVSEVLAHPQTEARGLLQHVPTSDGSQWLVLGSPLKLLSTPAAVRSAMPRLGFVDPQLASEFGLSVTLLHERIRASVEA